LIYKSLVDSAVKKSTNIHPYYFIEAGTDKNSLTGKINLDDLWKIVPSPQNVIYYLSGPPIMLKALSTGLAERALPPEQILMDAWE
jgi:NAD(P)H-flavin reductase